MFLRRMFFGTTNQSKTIFKTTQTFHAKVESSDPESIHEQNQGNCYQITFSNEETGSKIELFHESGVTAANYTRLTIDDPTAGVKISQLDNHAYNTKEVCLEKDNEKKTVSIVDGKDFKFPSIHTREISSSMHGFFKANGVNDPAMLKILSAETSEEIAKTLHSLGHRVVK